MTLNSEAEARMSDGQEGGDGEEAEVCVYVCVLSLIHI